MDNTKVVEVINRVAVHDYLSHLIDAKMKKITLFESFPLTGSPNLSASWTFILVDDLAKFSSLCGDFKLN